MPDQNPQQLGPWIISGLALVQILVIALVKKLRRASVDIYESANIEIGYSDFGPTLGLMGTLRAINKDVFVKQVSASVTKIKDNSNHAFHWRAFRSNSFSLNPNEPLRFEISSSFLLTHNNPFKYNIFLVDNSFSAEIAPKIRGISKKWFDHRSQRLKELEQQHKDSFELLIKNPMFEEMLFDEFSKSGVLVDEYLILDRACYWEAADYCFRIIVETNKPDKRFTKQFRFSLTDEDVKNLHLNTIATMRTLCGFTVRYNFAYPEYRN